jgi:precorrin-3B synthase
MRHHAALLPDWAAEQEPPAPAGVFAPDSPAFGLPFGAVAAGQLAAAVTLSGAGAVRLTPWRQIVFEGGHFWDCPAGFVPTDDRLLRADACIGAPLCPQAQSLTRDLARRLAAFVPDGLHVSGCAKGCARSAPASVVLTGRGGLYDLSLDGRAGDAPIRSGLTAVEVLRHFGAA